jgi:hypothetical protein
MTLESVQPLQKSVPGIFYGDKGGRCVVLITLPRLCAEFVETYKPQPAGTLRPVQGLLDF